MRARLRSWWHKPKQQRVRVAIIIGFGAFGIVLFAAFIGGYFFHWDWTGFGSYTPPTKNSNYQRGKTLWDWLQLLIIPLALAIIAILFNRSEHKNEQRIASDNQQEAALQEYIKEISGLLLHEKLRESQPGDEVRTIARVRTLTVLPHLESRRKRSVLKFLYEANLINADTSIVNLRAADLSSVSIIETSRQDTDRGLELWSILHNVLLDEMHADMNKVNLSEANLYNADLSSVNMIEADLSGAELLRTNFFCATLLDADLSEADMGAVEIIGLDAKITDEQLAQAKSLKGATMPDGSIHS